MAYKIVSYSSSVLTHADEIRSMSDEELAAWIVKIQNDALEADGFKYDLHWLRQPAEAKP
jgi:hypothetical protein